jgi:hypothetical protein
MGGDEKSDKPLSLDDLSLEPLDTESTFSEAHSVEEKDTKSKFKLDTRGESDRRGRVERRKAIRFEKDRRTGNDRRPKNNAWRNH